MKEKKTQYYYKMLLTPEQQKQCDAVADSFNKLGHKFNGGTCVNCSVFIFSLLLNDQQLTCDELLIKGIIE
jgi:hypothetical protein